MKEHITPKQAAMITEEQFYSLFPEGLVKRKDWTHFHHKKVTIGKMLAFLSVEGYVVDLKVDKGVSLIIHKRYYDASYTMDDVCDALWQAVTAIARLLETKGV